MVSVSDCTTRLGLIDDEKHHFDTFTDCFLPVLQLFEGLFRLCAVARLFYLLVTLCLRVLFLPFLCSFASFSNTCFAPRACDKCASSEVSRASLFYAQLCHYI